MAEKKMSEEQRARLIEWRAKYEKARDEYSAELAKMDEREKWYRGEQDRTPLFKGDEVTGDRLKDIPYCRNICAEMVEDQIDSQIPAPKVTARRREDEAKARLIENMLRNKIDLLPFERINDLMGRVVLIQGGCGYLVEWDSSVRTHDMAGELAVSGVHPKQIIPQPGVVTSIEDMDYVFVVTPTTRSAVERRFGVVLDENVHEEEPDARSSDGESAKEDIVTVVTAYYRSAPDKDASSTGIGKFSWCVDTVLEDLEDYQARRLRRCAKCNAVVPASDEVCPECGSDDIAEGSEDYEEIWQPIKLMSGGEIPGARDEIVMTVGEDGVRYLKSVLVPTKIPYYKPSKYPLQLQRNVSLYGRLFGDSDIDKLKDHQNTLNRVGKETIDKLMQGGAFAVLPADVKFTEGGGFRTVRIKDPADLAKIGVYSLEANTAQDMAFAEAIYKEAQQAIGVTDAFLGRHDSTATSGKAREQAASQAAGRLESKRAMKRAAFADLYELMFKFVLAYADEPIPVLSRDANGNAVYDYFNRYDFCEYDEATGEWYWNDAFIFDCDLSSSLASDREAMWQELRMNLQTGAFGNPQDASTLVMFWGLMEEQHYPGATQIKDHFEQLAEAQRQAAMNPPPAPVDPPTAPTAAVPEYAPTPGTNGIPGVYY